MLASLIKYMYEDKKKIYLTFMEYANYLFGKE